MINYSEPTVNLVESMGDTSFEEIWMMSKPNIEYGSDEERARALSALKKVDLPLTGVYHYNFIIGSSILFRELMLSLRPILPWARSNRIMPMTYENLPLMKYSYGSGYDKSVAEATIHKINKSYLDGEVIDIIKRELPLSVKCYFGISVDRRSLLAFIRTLEEMDEAVFNIYGLGLLKAIDISLDDYKKTKVHSLYDKLALSDNDLKCVKDNPVYVKKFDENTITTIVKSEHHVSAQFIRQHYSQVRNELFNRVKSEGYYSVITDLSTALNVTRINGDTQSFYNTVTRRSCWFANLDHESPTGWSSIIGDYVKDLSPKDFMNVLPCQGCSSKCNIVEETRGRLWSKSNKNTSTKGKVDPAPPCAVLIENPNMVEYRRNFYNSDSVLFSKWEQLRDAGLIKDNPSNAYRLEYGYDPLPNKSNYDIPVIVEDDIITKLFKILSNA